jgi:hypothetical protein
MLRPSRQDLPAVNRSLFRSSQRKAHWISRGGQPDDIGRVT